jgi:DNA-binding SARP family transcriptional activator/predicted negative regulator of RcsB-dependent stress response
MIDTPLGSPDGLAPGVRVRLTTLGTLSLQAIGGTDADRAAIELVATRRRTMALLVVLAVSRRPWTRDQLADFFWADRPPERARHSLAEALSQLRRALGRDVLSTRAQEVQLAAGSGLVVDVDECAAALAAGDPARAAATYGGPFLDGVYVDRAPRFEDWVQRQREVLRRQFVAASPLAVAAWRAEGRWPEAAAAARAWLDAEPESGPAAVAWLEALAAPATRAAYREAIEAYELHRQRLAIEFDEAPDAAVQRCAEQLAAALAEQAPPAATAPPVPLPAPDPDVRHTGGPGAGPPARPSRPSRRARIAGGAALLAVAAGATWQAVRPRPLAAMDEAPFIVLAEGEAAATDSAVVPVLRLAVASALGESRAMQLVPTPRVRDLLRLSRVDTLAPLDEGRARLVAQRIAARAVLVPALVEVAGRYRVAVRIVEPESGRERDVVTGDVVGADGLLESIDGVVRRVRRVLGESERATAAAAPLPNVTSASIVALRHYARGEALYDARQYAAALTAYESAIAVDSAFAMAHAAIGNLAYLLNQPEAGERAYAAAARQVGRLSPRERVSIAARHAGWLNQYDRAIALRREWLAQAPYDGAMLSGLAYDLFKARRFAESASRYRLLVRQDSTDWYGWLMLSKTLARLPGDSTLAQALAAARRAVALDSTLLDDPIEVVEYGQVLLRADRTDEMRRVFARLAGVRDSSRAARGLRLLGQLALWEGRPGEAIPPLREAARRQRASAEPLSELRSRLLLAAAYDGAGDAAAAARELEALEPLVPDVAEPIARGWAGAAFARAGRAASAARVLAGLDAVVVPANPGHVAARALLGGEVAVASGRPQAARSDVRAALATDSTVLAWETMARLLTAAGDVGAAREAWRRVATGDATFAWEGALARQRGLVEAARVARAAGDSADAARWVAMLRRMHPRADPAWRWLARAEGRAP